MAYEDRLSQYIALGKQIDELKTLRDDVANGIKSFMGEAGRGESNRYKVTWSSSSRSTFDHKRFAQEHPNVDLTDYYKVSNTRTFRVSEV